MPNRLINESSPYLLAHANNPVDWYPWGSEAFETARREDKPVFLSIGYSSCHWCHVMERESFEDVEVAAALNADYVAVKVDREERPDVDSVYMRFCTALTGSGGWPLTIIMTPEQKPFYAGTYLPKDSSGGRMGLLALLKAVAGKWRGRREELLKAGEDIYAYLSAQEQPDAAEPTEKLLRSAMEQLAAAYDKEYGGFGSAPKFPTPQNILFLLRYAHFTGDKAPRKMAETTLRQMYRGGIYDHIGGGFARYSTDREWLAPHFEKTLYDNALLALAYTESWQVSRLPFCRQAAEGTLDYCLRTLRSEEGGFYSGQDSELNGVEGGGWLMTEKEICGLLGGDDGRHFAECYDVTAEGNFHGKSIPNLLLNQRWNMLPPGYGEFRQRLLDYRERRGSPAVDDKILTGWNGMLLGALARAGRVFALPRFIEAADRLAAFMADKLWVDGRLMASRCKGMSRHPARLDDYAFYALGLLEMYDADHEPRRIGAAAMLAEEISASFAAPDGGCYLTAQDAEKLVLRPMEVFDGAAPSGNSAAALLFDRLFRLTGEPQWRQRRDGLLKFICGFTGKYPAGCPTALLALMSSLYPTRELVCVGAEGLALPEGVAGKYAPELTVLIKTPACADALALVAPFTADMTEKNGRSTAYLCSGGMCAQPMNY